MPENLLAQQLQAPPGLEPQPAPPHVPHEAGQQALPWLLRTPPMHHRSRHGGGADGGAMSRGPQSVQSVPRAQAEDSAPGPPSLHQPLEL